MSEETVAAESTKASTSSPDELALELMKFITVSTGYGKGSSSAGFGGKGPRSSEEHADALLELFNPLPFNSSRRPKIAEWPPPQAPV